MQVLKEEVLATRGGYVIKARLVLYHNRERRIEMTLERVSNVQFQEVGWSIEDLANLHNMLVKWKEKIGEQ